jgi:hypothetical protein
MPGGDGSNPGGAGSNQGGAGSNPGGAAGSGNDRMIIVVQLVVGAVLVMFAALLLVIFKATNVLGGSGDLTAVAGSVATGVLGVGAALLPSGAAASASARILSGMPSQPAAQAPVVAGVTATHLAAGGSHVAGSLVTADDGLWFVQWGDKSGDYLHTESGGSVTGKAVEQGVAADFGDLAAGKWVRVGFTALGTGQTVYSKETQVQ